MRLHVLLRNFSRTGGDQTDHGQGKSSIRDSHGSWVDPTTMASTRTSGRRPPALGPPVTPARRAISVEEWEAKAPLDDLELRSISALRAANEKIPLPLRVMSFDARTCSACLTHIPSSSQHKRTWDRQIHVLEPHL